MSNVIDITGRLKSNHSAFTSDTLDSGEIVDLAHIRDLRDQADRRETKRTILTEFISAFVVIPQMGLLKVTLHDLSEKGLSFDLPEGKGDFKLGETVAMRVYLNRQTYFPFIGRLANGRWIEDEGVIRQGVEFVKDTVNEEALYHFVRFIECVCTSLRTDTGDIIASNLNGL